MKKLLVFIALVVGVVGLAPVTSSYAASPACTEAANREFGASNITSGSGTYTPGVETTTTTEGPNPDELDLIANDDTTSTTYGPGTLDLVVNLEGKSCASIDYSIKVSAENGAELYSATVRSAGSYSVKLSQGTQIATNQRCVFVVATTSSGGEVLDAAPDTGTNALCGRSGGGQGWN